jgi:hypothetical protein
VTCRHCGRAIPANLLDCPLCFNRRAREHLLTQESRYIPDIRNGSVQLRLARLRPATRGHLEFVFLAGQAYCGEPLATHAARERVSFAPTLEHDVCRNCWQALQELMRTAA